MTFFFGFEVIPKVGLCVCMHMCVLACVQSDKVMSLSVIFSGNEVPASYMTLSCHHNRRFRTYFLHSV